MRKLRLLKSGEWLKALLQGAEHLRMLSRDTVRVEAFRDELIADQLVPSRQQGLSISPSGHSNIPMTR